MWLHLDMFVLSGPVSETGVLPATLRLTGAAADTVPPLLPIKSRTDG